MAKIFCPPQVAQLITFKIFYLGLESLTQALLMMLVTSSKSGTTNPSKATVAYPPLYIDIQSESIQKKKYLFLSAVYLQGIDLSKFQIPNFNCLWLGDFEEQDQGDLCRSPGF